MKTALLGIVSATLLTATAWSTETTCIGYAPYSSGHGAAKYDTVVLNISSQGNTLVVKTTGGDQATYAIVDVVPNGKVTKYELAAESGPIVENPSQTLRSDIWSNKFGQMRTSLVVTNDGSSVTAVMLYEELKGKAKVTKEPMKTCVQAQDQFPIFF